MSTRGSATWSSRIADGIPLKSATEAQRHGEDSLIFLTRAAGVACCESVARCSAGLSLALLLPIAGLQVSASNAPAIHVADPDGSTPLHWAAYRADPGAVERLILAGADVNARNDYGVTPLSLACTDGNAAIVEKLLNAGAEPDGAVRSGETPLMIAARTGSIDAVTLLLAYKADVNAKERWNGQTALMWAAAEGHASVAQLLIDHGADVHASSNSGATPLLFAVRRGNVDAVLALLAAGADVKATRPDGATALLVAVINGHEDLVDLLLDKGADPNVEGGSTDVTHPGMRAKPMKLTFRQLSESETDNDKARPGNIWGTPLHAAVHMGNWEIGDVSVAVKLDRVRVITALLAHGANVNARIRTEEPRWPGERYRRRLTGATPFLLAAKASDIEVMRLLLAHGADPNIGTIDRTTPLMAAAGIAWAANSDRASERKALETVKLLVDELGAEVNFVSDRGETAMHGAAYRGANGIVQYLYERGARLDVEAKDGRTPLIIADGVAYGNAFAAQPHTAVLLRQLLNQ
jgi:ankyrin repeat protein